MTFDNADQPWYGLVIEPTVACERNIWLGGEECLNSGKFAMVALPHRGFMEGDPPEGFHVSHLCSECALCVLRQAEQEAGRRIKRAKEKKDAEELGTKGEEA